MKRKFKKVYQFKITLQGIKPPVWRRIQVPETYTFWDLHVAIQDSMGWSDEHLHEFRIVNPCTGGTESIGIPDDEGWGPPVAPGWRRNIAFYFSEANPKAKYIYDFGDNWLHTVRLEKVLDRQPGVKYPLCVGGRRACPPEDCGGVPGYERLLEIVADPSHEEFETMSEWLGDDFEPEDFDPRRIIFTDPKERWKTLFQRF
ncbi:MAG: plasmid pRiA4b ORF-3 family protein [bacterium]